jgi:hypothetical protein
MSYMLCSLCSKRHLTVNCTISRLIAFAENKNTYRDILRYTVDSKFLIHNVRKATVCMTAVSECGSPSCCHSAQHSSSSCRYVRPVSVTCSCGRQFRNILALYYNIIHPSSLPFASDLRPPTPHGSDSPRTHDI